MSSLSRNPSSNGGRHEPRGSGLGIVVFFALILAVVAIVYGIQKQKTDMLESEIENLKQDSSQKSSLLDETMKKAKEFAESAKNQAILESTTKLYQSVATTMQFRYSRDYTMMPLDPDVDAGLLEATAFILASDISSKQDTKTGLRAGVYANPDSLSVTDWLLANSEQTYYSEDITLAPSDVSGNTAWRYQTPGVYTRESVVVPTGDVVVYLTASYQNDSISTLLAFEDVLASIEFATQKTPQ